MQEKATGARVHHDVCVHALLIYRVVARCVCTRVTYVQRRGPAAKRLIRKLDATGHRANVTRKIVFSDWKKKKTLFTKLSEGDN